MLLTPLSSFWGTLLHYLCYTLSFSTGLLSSAPKTSTDWLFLKKFSLSLLQTSTIILSSPLQCLFLRTAHTHCLLSIPGLCLAPKSRKWFTLLPFSWPHSQLQPARVFPGCLQEPREQKQLFIPFHAFLVWAFVHTLPPHGLPSQPPPPLAEVWPTFQVQSLQLGALTPSSLLCCDILNSISHLSTCLISSRLYLT